MANFKVFFTEEVAQQIEALVHATDDEVAWLGLGTPLWDKEKENVIGFGIDEIYVPKQEVSSTTVENDDMGPLMHDALDHWTDENNNAPTERMIYFGHSHVNMGVKPSSVDIKAWRDWVTGKPNDHAQWLVTTIHNKKGEVHAEVRVNAPGVGMVQFTAEVAKAPKPNPFKDWAEEVIKKQCTRKVRTIYPASRYTPMGFYSQQGHDEDGVKSVGSVLKDIGTRTKLGDTDLESAIRRLKLRTTKNFNCDDLRKSLAVRKHKLDFYDRELLMVLEAWHDIILDNEYGDEVMYAD